MGDMGKVIETMGTGIVVFVLTAIIILLVFREVLCWYWKINQNVALLTEVRDILGAIAYHIKGNSQGRVSPEQVSPAKSCTGCGTAVVDVGSAFCSQCGVKL